MECRNCHVGELKQPDGKGYAICSDCGAFELLYTPQPYQSAFHKDPHHIRGLFGG
jgi:transcription initiation factor TFIIIB Brf1 subunit/transcription initiation factor TFIIB